MAVEVFSSAARTATTNSKDIGSMGYAGGIFVIDVTAVSGTSPTLVISIHHKDQNTGKYTVSMLSSASLSAVGTTRLRVHPALALQANLAASDMLGDEFRVVATIGGTSPSFTFSVTFDGVR